jgi:hypothetical protein
MMGLALAATLGLCAPAGAGDNPGQQTLRVLHPDRELKGAATVSLYHTACVDLPLPLALQSAMWTAVTDFGMSAIQRRMVQLTEEIRDAGYNVRIWCALISNRFPTD